MSFHSGMGSDKVSDADKNMERGAPSADSLTLHMPTLPPSIVNPPAHVHRASCARREMRMQTYTEYSPGGGGWFFARNEITRLLPASGSRAQRKQFERDEESTSNVGLQVQNPSESRIGISSSSIARFAPLRQRNQCEHGREYSRNPDLQFSKVRVNLVYHRQQAHLDLASGKQISRGRTCKIRYSALRPEHEEHQCHSSQVQVDLDASSKFHAIASTEISIAIFALYVRSLETHFLVNNAAAVTESFIELTFIRRSPNVGSHYRPQDEKTATTSGSALADANKSQKIEPISLRHIYICVPAIYISGSISPQQALSNTLPTPRLWHRLKTTSETLSYTISPRESVYVQRLRCVGRLRSNHREWIGNNWPGCIQSNNPEFGATRRKRIHEPNQEQLGRLHSIQ
ncbi:hypothetical protein B0H13DRAFT_2264537 [Mycena leptocephala]|nr:hypothetical protein B0H13DRAFT_2264537 [Mycena leptocephala]